MFGDSLFHFRRQLFVPGLFHPVLMLVLTRSHERAQALELRWHVAADPACQQVESEPE
jgi:hypothetical protein